MMWKNSILDASTFRSANELNFPKREYPTIATSLSPPGSSVGTSEGMLSAQGFEVSHTSIFKGNHSFGSAAFTHFKMQTSDLYFDVQNS